MMQPYQKEAEVMFSIVIPLYNKQKYILEAIASVLEQTYQSFEIIFVNDGSTDEGAELVKKAFPQVRIIHQQNMGAAEARNHGMREAKSDWVVFLDADDFWYPVHLEELVELIGSYDQARLVSTRWQEVNNETEVLSTPVMNVERGYIDFFHESVTRPVVWSSAAAVHRETALQIGGFRHFKTSEDSELWTRMALQWPVSRSTRVTAVYRRVEGSLMASESVVGRFGDGRVTPPVSFQDLEKELRTVSKALAHGGHKVADIHLRRYLDHLLLRRAKQQLVRGDARGARGFLSLIDQIYSKQYFVLRGLSLIPGWVTWGGLYTKRKIKYALSIQKRV